LLIKGGSFAAHGFKRGLRRRQFPKGGAAFAFQIADTRFGTLARFGQFGLAAAQIALQAGRIAAGSLRTRTCFTQLPFQRCGAVHRATRGQFQIRNTRAKPFAFTAQTIAFIRQTLSFLTQQRQ
jgi:hypothetical protein